MIWDVHTFLSDLYKSHVVIYGRHPRSHVERDFTMNVNKERTSLIESLHVVILNGKSEGGLLAFNGIDQILDFLLLQRPQQSPRLMYEAVAWC